MKNRIYLNDNDFLDLPKLIVSKLLAVANSGGGKSWLIRRIVEQAYGKVQIIIIDPEGEFSTLREKYDFILCGKGMDAPAEPRSAALLARRLLESKTSAIIDLYELHPQERKHFVRLFFESMVNAPKNLYNDCLIVLDEAHKFAPEKDESEAASAVIEMASLGRKRGFSLILATQRISKLSKDAAAECNNKLVGRTSLDIDRKRAADELGITNKEDVLALRNLQPGEFFAFGPAISNEVIKLKVGDVQTSIPKAGRQTKVAPPSDKIKKELAALADLPQEAEKEAKTMADLQAEIRRLKNQPGHNPDVPMGVSQWKNHGEKFGYSGFFKENPELINAYKAKIKEWVAFGQKLMRIILEVNTAAQKLEKEKWPTEMVYTTHVAKSHILPEPKPERKYPERFPGKGVPITEFLREEAEQKEMGIGERKILIAVAQHDGATREHLTVMTGYKRSSRDAYIQRLQSKGFVRAGNGKINPTSEGIEALGADYEPLPTGDELRTRLMTTLPIGESKILALLMDSYPQAISRDDLSMQTGYQRSSRDAYIQRLTARQLVEQEGRGMVKASDKLFS